MAAATLLALIDDMASALDDVAMMTKIATKKTAGVLGDDLALNAEQVIGIHAKRELPVVWAVAKGSALNKLLLIPLALLINNLIPPLVTVLLMLGGLYLCFEGVEKIIEKLFDSNPKTEKKIELRMNQRLFEKEKIKGAVRTDFVLSAEIIVITLGIVSATPLSQQVMVLASISLIMTIGVYGLVACIVKLDDLGLILIEKKGGLKTVGKILIGAAPMLMKFLGIFGTIAMLLVGGGIISHSIPFIHRLTEHSLILLSQGVDLIVGIISGGISALIYLAVKKIKKSNMMIF